MVLEIQTALNNVLNNANDIFAAEAGLLAIVDSFKKAAVVQAATGPWATTMVGAQLPLQQSIIGQVMGTDSPVLIAELPKDSCVGHTAGELPHLQLQSLIGLRFSAGKTVGAIVLFNIRPDYLTQDGAKIITMIANQAALTIANADLKGRLRQQSEEQAMLFRSMNTITSDLAMDTVLAAVSRQLFQALKADLCTISRWNRDTRELSVMQCITSPAVKCPEQPVRRLENLSLSLTALESQSTTIVEINSPLLLKEDIDRLELLNVPVLFLIPLIYGRHTIGLVEIGRRRNREPLTTGELQLAETIAAQAAITIEHARLYEEANLRLAEARVLQNVMVAAASSLDFDEILRSVITALHSTLGIERLGIFLPDDHQTHLVAQPTTIGFPADYNRRRVPIDGSLAGDVYRSGEAALVTQVNQASPCTPLIADSRSMICVPVFLDDRVAAVLSAESPRLHAFDQEDINLFKAIAAELSVALGNARLFEAEHRRAKQQQALLDIFADLSAELEPAALFNRIIQRAIEVIPKAEAGSLIVPRGDSFVYGAAVGFDFKAMEQITFSPQDFAEHKGWFEKKSGKQTLIMRFSQEELRQLHEEVVTSPYDQLVSFGRLKEIKSSLRVLLSVGDRILGAINVDSLSAPNAFTAEDEQTLSLFASQAAIAVQNARLFEDIRTAEANYRDLFDNANDFIFTLDSNFKVSSANKVVLQSTGYQLHELIGLPVRHFVRPKQLPALFKLVKKHLGAKQFLPSFQLVVLGRTGQERLLEVTMRIQRRDGRPTGLHCIARDITQRRELERQLRQTEKLSTIGKLVAGVAHELNNPLTSIIGYASFLQDSDLPPAHQEDLNVIFRQAERARVIIKDLLTFARKIDLDIEPVTMNDILDASLSAMKLELLANNITVETSLEMGLTLPAADPQRLEQVFTNLITNAIQAMATTTPSGRIAINGWRTENAIIISLADNGPGIPDTILHRIFDPFFSTKQVGEGTGLGLSICYGIISEHKGRIWAENLPVGGAIFYIELPVETLASMPPMNELPSQLSTVASAGQPQLHILVVDDEPALQKLLKRILTKLGYTIDTAANGTVALKKLMLQSYDLVICDILMPDMSGPKLYQHVKKDFPYLTDKFIFITGNVVDFETQAFLEESGAVWLSKPFLPSDIKQAVVKMLKTADLISS